MTPASTVKMLAIRSAIARQEIPEEAQKLLDLYNDPDVSPEQKRIARSKIDDMIKELEERVDTGRKLRNAKS